MKKPVKVVLKKNIRKESEKIKVPSAIEVLCPKVSEKAPVGISIMAKLIIKNENNMLISVCERPFDKKNRVYVTEAIVPNPCRKPATYILFISFIEIYCLNFMKTLQIWFVKITAKVEVRPIEEVGNFYQIKNETTGKMVLSC